MKLDRMIGILAILLQKERVTAPYLAQRFEVSRRTITRDLDALCRAGIPVVTMQGMGGGISIAEGYRIDKSVLTYEELESLVASLRGFGSVTGPTQMERIIDKLAIRKEDMVVSLPDQLIIDLASNETNHLRNTVATMREAIRMHRLVTFTYYYEKGVVTRKIEPYCLIFRWGNWYLFGYCLLRCDFRLFRITRLWDIQVHDETYSPRAIPAGKIDGSGFFLDDQFFTAIFSPSVMHFLIDTYGRTCYEVLPDGQLLARLFYTNEAFIVRWLLGFGGDARVISPQSLADTVQAAAKKILDAYTQTGQTVVQPVCYDQEEEKEEMTDET